MKPEPESGHDAEITTAATYRPEEVGIRPSVHAQALAVRGHEVCGQQVIDRKAMLTDEISDSATKGESADPD
jgi:hypothetical protein